VRAEIEDRGLGMQAKMPISRTKRKVSAWPERYSVRRPKCAISAQEISTPTRPRPNWESERVKAWEEPRPACSSVEC
jgi:hypothetical protein